jgi:very-short-patch-repair endonuclease
LRDETPESPLPAKREGSGEGLPDKAYDRQPSSREFRNNPTNAERKLWSVLRVIRLWNNDVLANIDGVVETIERALRDRPSPGHSRSGGRGS